MRAIANFTLKSLSANRVRTLVTIAGVALAAALLTAVMTSYTSLNGFLYDSEREVSGNWMAQVHTETQALAEGQIGGTRTDPNVDAIASVSDVGFGELDAQKQNILGKYLPIGSYKGDIEELCAIRPTSGRLPNLPSEILLPDTWESRGYAQIGSALEVNIGQRRAIVPEGKDVESYEQPLGYETRKDATIVSNGDALDSTMGYFNGPGDDEAYGEELVDTAPYLFTVVGFYSPYTYALSTSVGQMGLVGPDNENRGGPTSVYLSFNGQDSTDQMEELVAKHFPKNDGIVYHSSLLRYMGFRGNSAIWDTFFGLAAVLSLVIIIACISLIYNAFAISVAERTSQFGLLASIGASRRQLRRAVLIEGLMVALIGIPLGLLLGVGGCAITFSFIGPMISNVLGSLGVEFRVQVASWALILAAALTLVTVMASVLIPALRTGRLNPIESIRQNRHGKVSVRGIHNAMASTNPAKLWKAHGILSRLFGMGGTLARINGKRSKAKGRAASLSLALAIVLLMTAGSLNLFIGDLVSAVNVSSSYDIGVLFDLEESDELTPEDMSYYSGAYEAMEAAPGAEGQGWFLGSSVALVMDPALVSESFIGNRPVDSSNAGMRHDGTWGASGNIYLLEDELFNAYAESIGVDPNVYYDADNPQVIAVDRTYSMFDGKYQLVRTFDRTGDVQILDKGEYMGMPVEGYTSYSWNTTAEKEEFEFAPVFTPDVGAGYEDTGDLARAGLDLDQLPKTQVHIGALATETPEIISQHTESMQLIAPVSLAAADAIPIQYSLFTAAFDARNLPHAEVVQSIDQAFTAFDRSAEGIELSFYSINDHLAEAESTQTLAFIVNVFCLLFTGILTLIAMANVFNTVTNGLILRRREFAVMKSIGLSNRQFRSMITDECMDYSIRGLIPGLIVSVLVSYLLYRMVGLSTGGLAFSLPWGYLAIAVALTLLAMLVSVAYGMHRCRADDVVEALRADNV